MIFGKNINKKTILITVITANNEIGTIQNIAEIGRIAKNNNIVFHTDAVQAIGNVRIDVNKMNIDMLSMSAHKFYGPKGVGALYIKENIKFYKLQDGGHQERDKRAGTENVSGIVGLGKAIELASFNLEEYNRKLTKLRQYFISEVEKKLGKDNVKLNGDKIKRLPGNVSISFKNIDSNSLLLELDKSGICASGGSACSSGSNQPSHVLLAIGLPKKWLEGTIRFSFGESNSIEEIKYIIRVLEKIINRENL